MLPDWGENMPPLVGDETLLPVAAGVVGEDPGIGGNDSSKEAPNDDDGLKGLRPLKPVI